MNKVFHLDVEAHSTRFGCLREKHSRYAGLFFTHEEAYQKGKEVLAKKIQKLFEASDYCDGKGERTRKDHARDRAHHKPGRGTLEGFVGDGQVSYNWKITEIDLDRLSGHEGADAPNEWEYRRQSPPIHIEHTYDRDGELLHRYYVWRMELQAFESSATYRQNREGDDLPEAGTKFRIGDFVRLKRALASMDGRFGTDAVFVITALPRRRKEGQLLENTYRIETVSEDGEYQWDSDFHLPFSGVHENELVKHEGEVATDSPLWFLRRAHLGELGDIGEIIERLQDGEIALSPSTTWEELQ